MIRKSRIERGLWLRSHEQTGTGGKTERIRMNAHTKTTVKGTIVK
jgi:hypothetical protein